MSFDLAALASAINTVRVERNMTLATVAREAGVAAATIRRYQSAQDAEADGVLALLGWLDAVPEHFVNDSSVAGEPLPPAGTGLNRIDMDAVRRLSTWPTPRRAGTRTTIQRLVLAAQHDKRTIASLTRWSPG